MSAFSQIAELPGKLKRVTSSGSFIPEIDGLRFIAIFGVLVYHTNKYLLNFGQLRPAADDWLCSFLSHGNFGVKLFFALSGFILTLPFARNRLAGGKAVDIGKYFLRRLTRIEPPYIISLVLYFVTRVFIKREYTLAFLSPHFLASLFYSSNIVFPHTLPLVNFVTWSLEIEVQFYILAPLLALVFCIPRMYLRRLIICGSAFAWAALSPHFASPDTLATYLHFFLVGFLLSDLYVLNWQTPSKHPLWWDVAGLAAWGVLIWSLMTGVAVSFVAIVCIAVAYSAALRSRYFRAVMQFPWITAIGGMCYTLYLYHPLFSFVPLTKQFMFGTTYDINVLWQIVITVPLVIVLSSIVYLAFEKPFMYPDWPQKLMQQIRGRKSGDLPVNS